MPDSTHIASAHAESTFGYSVGLLDPIVHGTDATRLTDDAAWLQALVDTELALTRALIRVGLVPEWMSEVVDRLDDPAWLGSSIDLAQIAAHSRAGGNPVIPLVKALGAAAEELHPGASDHIHVGATSQDIVDTATMLIARGVAREVFGALSSLADSLAGLADTHRRTPMAGRTLGQQASPMSFGLVAAQWLDAVLTVRARLDRVNDELPAQLGGAVGTLSTLTDRVASRLPQKGPDIVIDEIVAGFAAELSLRAPSITWHTDRLAVTTVADALASVAGAVGAFALEVTVLARTEIAELSERLGAGEGGSSAMPHKRNPVTAFLIVSAARRAPGLLATLHGSLLSEDQRPSGAWHAEWPTLRDLESLTVAAAQAAASLADRLEVDTERMRANLEITDGLIYSERVSTILSEALGKRAAFELVEAASHEALDTHRPLQVVLSGRLATDGHDESLRALIWKAFEPDGALGQSDRMISRVLERHTRERTATP